MVHHVLKDSLEVIERTWMFLRPVLIRRPIKRQRQHGLFLAIPVTVPDLKKPERRGFSVDVEKKRLQHSGQKIRPDVFLFGACRVRHLVTTRKIGARVGKFFSGKKTEGHDLVETDRS